MERQTTLVGQPINSVTPIYFFWGVPIHRPFFASRRYDSSARGMGPYVLYGRGSYCFRIHIAALIFDLVTQD